MHNRRHEVSLDMESTCPMVTGIEGPYTPRRTLNSLNNLTGKGTSSLHTMLIGRSPSADSSVTRPQARYASPLRGRTNSWNCQPFPGLSMYRCPPLVSRPALFWVCQWKRSGLMA
jgi:hypothetical protein